MAGRRLGALERGGGVPPPFPMHRWAGGGGRESIGRGRSTERHTDPNAAAESCVVGGQALHDLSGTFIPWVRAGDTLEHTHVRNGDGVGGGGGDVCGGGGGGGVWHKASVFGCLPSAAPIGLSPLLILTLCGSEHVFGCVNGWGGGDMCMRGWGLGECQEMGPRPMSACPTTVRATLLVWVRFTACSCGAGRQRTPVRWVQGVGCTPGAHCALRLHYACTVAWGWGRRLPAGQGGGSCFGVPSVPQVFSNHQEWAAGHREGSTK